MKQHLNQHLGTSFNTDDVLHKKEKKKKVKGNLLGFYFLLSPVR